MKKASHKCGINMVTWSFLSFAVSVWETNGSWRFVSSLQSLFCISLRFFVNRSMRWCPQFSLGMRASSLVSAIWEKKRQTSRVMATTGYKSIPLRKFYVMRIFLGYLLKKLGWRFLFFFFNQTKHTLRNIKNISLVNYVCPEKRSRNLRLSPLRR